MTAATRTLALRGAAERFFRGLWWTPRPRALAWLLWPLSVLVALVARLVRARARPALPLNVPVLVVGNLVVGGAGKTPTVMALVAAFRARGLRVGIVSRGHGRHAGDGAEVLAVRADSPVQAVGDEPLLMARRTGAPVFVGRQRRSAALALLQAHPELDLIVADDGLQHLALPRQAELLVFDERGCGNGLRLPAGPLRETLPASQHLGLAAQPGSAPRGGTAVPRWVLYTAGRASTPLPGHLAQRSLALAWPLAAWHQGDITQAQPLQALRGRPLLAAAGLAAPDKFFAMLREAGLAIDTLPLPDHHDFATLPWGPQGPDVLVTEKDAIKLQAARCAGRAVWVLPLDLLLPTPLLDALQKALFHTPHPSSP